MTTFFAPKYTSKTRLDGKTAVVTGCNTGLGKYVVFDFCRRGCRVIMACRNVEKAEAAKNDILKKIIEEMEKGDKIGVMVVKELDLSSMKSIRKCAQEILEEEPRIDLLVNNAGIFGVSKTLTEDGYESQFAVNHLGHFLLTLLLMPRIIQSAPARIINVSSKGHSWLGDKNFEDINYETHKYKPLHAYGRSKLANVLFTKELAKRLEEKNVNVYAVHPGAVKTDATRYWNNEHPYLSKVTDKLINWTFRSVKEGAQSIIFCALDEKTGTETGLYYENCKLSTESKDARDPELAKKLWDLSVEWVKLDFDPFTDDDKNSGLT